MSVFSCDRKELAALCEKYGVKLKQTFAAGLDPGKVIWALCGNESSFGVGYQPRHELGYCHGHMHYDAHATTLWGCWAHCSYGVTQMMWKNCGGISPIVIATDVDAQLAATNAMLQRPEFKGASLEKIAREWNGPKVSEQYIADLHAHYGVAP